MAHLQKLIQSVFILVVMITLSCSDDPDPNQNQNPNNPPPPPGGGEVTITSVEGGHMFWGDEMIIKGTGFSATKEENIIKLTSVYPTQSFCSMNYTSEAGGAIEIINATTTQLRVKIPLKLINNMPSCGPEKANLEVTVNGKKGTKEGLKFNGLPYIRNFAYHYGWFDIPSVTRIDDSVMIRGGMLGFYSRESELWDDIKLSIDGDPIEIKHRTIGVESGWAFYLPAEKYAITTNCSEEPDGWAARKMKFTFSVGDKSASNDLYVQYVPQSNASCKDCPATTAGLNSADSKWVIRGKNIWYTEVRFNPQQPCGGSSQGVSLNKSKMFDDEVTFQVPLSILAPGCTYTVVLTDQCDRGESLGSFTR